MTREDIYSMLQTLGLPVRFHHFPAGTAPAAPYICYDLPNSDDLYADDRNYIHISALYVMLFQSVRETDTQSRVDELLNSNGIPYSMTEIWIESEGIYELLYECEVLIDG